MDRLAKTKSLARVRSAVYGGWEMEERVAWVEGGRVEGEGRRGEGGRERCRVAARMDGGRRVRSGRRGKGL